MKTRSCVSSSTTRMAGRPSDLVIAAIVPVVQCQFEQAAEASGPSPAIATPLVPIPGERLFALVLLPRLRLLALVLIVRLRFFLLLFMKMLPWVFCLRRSYSEPGGEPNGY